MLNNAFKCTNHANFFANKTLPNPNSGSNQNCLNNHQNTTNTTNVVATLTKPTNQTNRASLNRSPNTYNANSILPKSVSFADTNNNYNNNENVAISASSLDHRNPTEVAATTAAAMAATLLSGQHMPNTSTDTTNGDLVKISRQIAIHKKKEMSAINERILLSTIVTDSEDSKNPNSTPANETLTDQWKSYKANSFMAKYKTSNDSEQI